MNSFLRVFMVQAILSLIVGIPLLFISAMKEQPSLPFIILLVAATSGVLIEGIADYQKFKFKQNGHHRQKVCDVGLWAYSRHPNYFGELLFWWCLSFAIFWQTKNIFVLIGPLFLNILLLKVSGVPMLEQFYRGNVAYDEYKKKTNRLIPWRKNA